MWRNDKLPELGVPVLVCYSDREGYHIFIQTYKTVHDQRDGDLTGWYENNGFKAYPKPIPFWHPLPKPPTATINESPNSADATDNSGIMAAPKPCELFGIICGNCSYVDTCTRNEKAMFGLARCMCFNKRTAS